MSETTGKDMRYGLSVTPDTAEWLNKFAAGFKGSKADVHAFRMVGSALSDAFGDKREADADGRVIYALYLPTFDADGISAETIMNRVADVINKRAGRSKIDKAAIMELRAEIPGAMADAYMVDADTPAPVATEPTPAPVLPVILPEAVADMVAVSAPVAPAAPVKPKRTRKAKGAPADVVAEIITVPAAPVAGDIVAGIARGVGEMLNKWAAVAEGADRMSPAARREAAGALALDFAQCAGWQNDADGSGTSLAELDADANKIMHSARKLLRHFHVVIMNSPKITGRLDKGTRRTLRRTVAPWRADASASLSE